MRLLACAALIISTCIALMRCEDPEEFPPRELPPFNRIQSNGGVTFKLVTGPENKVISTSMSETAYSVSGGQLNINAAWGSMTIAIRNLPLLWCNACTVEASGLVADTLSMYIHGGSADLRDITIAGYLGLSALNIGTYKFSGTVPFFNVYSVNNADVEAFNLVTDSTYVNSYAALAHTEIHATKVVNVFIHSAGSVYYKGNPPIVRLSNQGTGKLIAK
jgi:hypothetical protein